ncbi:MAG TPA: insulinase family protein [Candidatus Polarisedimenticolia bacterium]|nr:insulinase family protein [Candidatus Polarisedimenticolia bacterium]
MPIESTILSRAGRALLAAAASCALASASAPLSTAAPEARAGKEAGIFPFPYAIDDLDNGLRLVTVPLPYPDLVSLYVVVRAGSRNEVEPGKSGFAHFFEHMMFRGTDKYPPEKYNDVMKAMGADHNAFTTDDFTAYHMLFGKEDLDQAMEVEADRFQNLSYPLDAFKTEANAVLGEYNKNSANPIQKLFEVMREASFATHTYRHTTMGFLEDIQDMPNQYEYSKQFFHRFYRPENVVLVVAGDVQRDAVLALARKHWGGWKRGDFRQTIPAEPGPSGPHLRNIEWPTDTLPWVVVGYRGPAFSTEKPDLAALELAAEVAFSESSPLHQRLVIEEQKVDNLLTYVPSSRDPGLLLVGARVKDPSDLVPVRDALLATIEDLRGKPVDAGRLAAVKSNLKYGFALGMDNTQAVAAGVARFVQLDPTPETINRLYALYDRITPGEVMEAAVRYLTPPRRTIATLTPPGVPAPPPPADDRDDPDEETASIGRAARTPAAPGVPAAAAGTADHRAAGAGAGLAKVLRPADVPLVSFRILFQTGAAHDPEGKEGLAALTAALLSQGGTRSLSYQEVVQALYPMAAGIASQVDKEMTVFSGTTHLENLDAYHGILSSMLLEPGWREEDFRRVRDDAVNHLKVNLRGNNDEELGKEALYLTLFDRSHPYGHENTGTVESLRKLTLADVQAFYKERYTRASVTLGLAGGYPAGFPERMEEAFSRLPAGSAGAPLEIPPAPKRPGQRLTIVKKDTRATAISLGFPIEVTRRHQDWAALWLATSWLGQHRSSNSHLYQRLRETRGLNYGDYAYIEHFPRGMFLMQPEPNLARQRQLFQIWIRPVEPANAHFALRAALYELRKLADHGLTQEQFEETRRFLEKHVAVMARTQSAQLGYALDGRWYGTGDFVPWIRQKLSRLTRDQVNRAIREHLRAPELSIVMVAKDAERLRDAVVSNAPSPAAYNSPKPAEVMEEDKVIQSFPLGVAAGDVVIVPVEEVFER